MSEYNIRIAVIDDAVELQKLMYEAFTPLRELGIDWPSVNATAEMVEKNLQTGTTFVLKNEKELFFTITLLYLWKSNAVFLFIHLYGGLLLSHHMMDRV